MLYRVASGQFSIDWFYRQMIGQITGILVFRGEGGKRDANVLISNIIEQRSLADCPMLLAFEAQNILNLSLSYDLGASAGEFKIPRSRQDTTTIRLVEQGNTRILIQLLRLQRSVA
jgi:hypothetical protein